MLNYNFYKKEFQEDANHLLANHVGLTQPGPGGGPCTGERLGIGPGVGTPCTVRTKLDKFEHV